ncbi:MAG TPA: hypothetical protein VMV22_14790 [Acidimicrobiales bacterium]|nr:hypothetical protein [Acidimicrobiales bacterium]
MSRSGKGWRSGFCGVGLLDSGRLGSLFGGSSPSPRSNSSLSPGSDSTGSGV